MLSGGHAEARPFGEPIFPDVAGRRDPAAGNSGNVTCLVGRVFLRSRLVGQRVWGRGLAIFSPAHQTPSLVRVRYLAESSTAT